MGRGPRGSLIALIAVECLLLGPLLVQSGLLAITFYFSATLTIYTMVVLELVTYLFRGVLEPGYAVGERVASVIERVQDVVQAGTQGIGDIKVFTMTGELFGNFKEHIDQYAKSTIKIDRNELAIDKGFNLAAALTVFALVYLASVFTTLSLGKLGLFLFAIFQLAPFAGQLNKYV